MHHGAMHLRISIADDNAAAAKMLSRLLDLLGHTVVSEASDGRQLVEHALALSPDLIVTDVLMPDLDGIDAARAVNRQRPTPVVLISGKHTPELVSRAKSDCISSYVVKPYTRESLEANIGLALQRFAEFQSLRQEAADLRQALEDRKKIERAKGVLMKRATLNEDDAFRRLQSMANDNQITLAEAARRVLVLEKSLHPDETQS